MKYIKPLILLLGIISESYLIYMQFTHVDPGTKSQIMLLLHAVLLAFFVYALIYTIKALRNKK